MKTKQLLMVNMYVFGVVALLHLWRALSGFELSIGTFMLPVWGSFVAFAFAGYLAWLNYKA